MCYSIILSDLLFFGIFLFNCHFGYRCRNCKRNFHNDIHYFVFGNGLWFRNFNIIFKWILISKRGLKTPLTSARCASVWVARVRGHGVDPVGAGQWGPGQGGGALPDLAPQRRHVLPNILLLHHIFHWIQVTRDWQTPQHHKVLGKIKLWK